MTRQLYTANKQAIMAIFQITVAILLGLALLVDGSNGQNASDSCVGRCDTPVDGSFPCQCNTVCETYGDCCDDYHHTCLGADLACRYRCDNAYNPSDNCHCNSLCKDHNNCCGDYDAYCPSADLACRYRCDNAYNPSDNCHCNSLCKDHNNCCGDYDAYCTSSKSCYGRCSDPIIPEDSCQCNSACLTKGDCCPDFSDEGQATGITLGELSALADDLWASDDSRASPSEYTLNKQALVPDGNTADQSPLPLFTYVNEAAVFSRPTFAAFISLLDNYNPQYGVDEDVTPEEQVEYHHFMDTIMVTNTMITTANFLISKGYFTDINGFRAKIDQAWFTLYDRSSSTDSSGFEHVFLGEYRGGNKVNGFHNWVQFYMLEKDGLVNYLGYVREDVPHDLLGANFVWNGYNKALGTFMYGASIEFELAMMTTCFTAFPGRLCNFDLNGTPIAIQTYVSFTNLVGSSYFSV